MCDAGDDEVDGANDMYGQGTSFVSRSVIDENNTLIRLDQLGEVLNECFWGFGRCLGQLFLP